MDDTFKRLVQELLNRLWYYYSVPIAIGIVSLLSDGVHPGGHLYVQNIGGAGTGIHSFSSISKPQPLPNSL